MKTKHEWILVTMQDSFKLDIIMAKCVKCGEIKNKFGESDCNINGSKRSAKNKISS